MSDEHLHLRYFAIAQYDKRVANAKFRTNIR
jgi:hypothetical protein